MKESRLKSINGFGSERVLAADDIKIAVELAHTSKESWKYRDFLSVLAKSDEHLPTIVQAQCARLGTVSATVFGEIQKLAATRLRLYLKLISSLAPYLSATQTTEVVVRVLPTIEEESPCPAKTKEYIVKEAFVALVPHLLERLPTNLFNRTAKALLPFRNAYFMRADRCFTRALVPLLLENQFDNLSALATLTGDELEKLKAETVWGVHQLGPQMQAAQLTQAVQVLLPLAQKFKKPDLGYNAITTLGRLMKHLPAGQYCELITVLCSLAANKQLLRMPKLALIRCFDDVLSNTERSKSLSKEQLEQVRQGLLSLSNEEPSVISSSALALGKLAKLLFSLGGENPVVEDLLRLSSDNSDKGWRSAEDALLSLDAVAEHLQSDELEKVAREFLKKIKIFIAEDDHLYRSLDLNFVKYLPNKSRADFVSAFLSMLNSSKDISQHASEVVIRLLSKIIKFLSHEDRIAVFYKLLNLSLERDSNGDLRVAVMHSFDNFAKDLSDEECKEVLPKLLSFANCTDNHAKSAAAYCLGEFAKRFSGQELKHVLDTLEKLAKDVDAYVRLDVGVCLNSANFTELREKDYERVFAMLLSLTQDEDPDVCCQAKETLGSTFATFPDGFSKRKLDRACEQLLALAADAKADEKGEIFVLDSALGDFAHGCSKNMLSTVVKTLLETIKKEHGIILKAVTTCFKHLVSALQETQLLEVGKVLLVKLEQESDLELKDEMLFVLSDICSRLLPTRAVVDMAKKILAIAEKSNAFELEAKIRLCLFDSQGRGNVPSPTSSSFEALLNATWEAGASNKRATKRAFFSERPNKKQRPGYTKDKAMEIENTADSSELKRSF